MPILCSNCRGRVSPWKDINPSATFDCVRGEPCGPCVALSDLDAQILETEALLEELKQRRDDTRTEMNRVHDPLIQQVPPEIASYIFTLDFYDDETHKDWQPRPLVLASVCRAWRQIALSTHQIWTSLDVCRKGREWNFPVLLAEQYLPRSGQLPLDITLFWEDITEDPVVSTIETLIEVICANSNRWNSLEIEIPPSAFSFFKSDTIINSNLESLSIDCYSSSSPTTASPFNPTNITLHPKKVSLFYMPLSLVLLNWENLVELDIFEVTYVEIHSVLRQCLRIEKLILFVKNSQEPAPPTPICLRYLTSLRYNSTPSVRFCDLLTAPALRTLRSSISNVHLDMISLISMLKRSACLLTEFELEGRYMAVGSLNEEALADLLYDLPSLRTLSLIFGTPVFSNEGMFFRLMGLASSSGRNISGSSRPFLPSLESFSYEGPTCFSWNTIAAIFRIHAGRRFTSSLDQNVRQSQDQPSLRPLSSLTALTPDPKGDEDLIDKESLLSFFQLPENNMKVELNNTLMKASIEHHHLTPDQDVSSFYHLSP